MPFKKGQSGNPLGRKIGSKSFAYPSLSKEVIATWKEIALETDPKTRKAKLRALIDKLYEKAISGDVRAAEIILERTQGKVVQSFGLFKTEPPIELSEIPTAVLEKALEEHESNGKPNSG